MALHESFLSHAGGRWLKLGLLLIAASIAAYAWHDPAAGPNGGTWLGYTLGTIGALLIVWLTLLGVRKRSYRSNLGTVKGWTSAHVWLGLALIVVGTLHTGWQFGLNIHTLAWLLMMLVIVSGIWGVVSYVRYPTQITANRGAIPAQEMLREVAELDRQLLLLAAELGRETHERTLTSINRTRIGGGFWRQVLGVRQGQAPAEGLISRLREELNKPAFAGSAPQMGRGNGGADSGQTMMFMASAFVSAEQDAKQKETRRKLLDVLSRKKALVAQLNEDITRRARMSVWLYLHVPLTIGLLAALLAHILSVFLYW